MIHRVRSMVKTTWWRGLIAAILVVLFATFLIKERSEILELPRILNEGQPLAIVVGIIVSGLYILSQSLFLQATIETIGKQFPLKDSINLFLKRLFYGSFIPAGYTVTQYTVNAELKDHNISDLESHLASTLFLVISSITFALLLTPTIFYLLFTSQLTKLEWYGSIALVIGTIIFALEFFVFFFRRRGFSYQLIKRILPDLPEFLSSWKNKSFHKAGVVKALFFTTLSDFLGIGLILTSLAALKLPFSFAHGLIAYVLTMALLVIAPIFQGIGIVEISLSLILTQLGISYHNAVQATLLYRFFQLWLPLAAGLFIVSHKPISKIHQNLTGDGG